MSFEQVLDGNNDFMDEGVEYTTVEKLRADEKSAQEVIDLSHAAQRLAENKDFQKLFMDIYQTREPARIATMLASGRFKGEDYTHLQNEVFAIGHFSNFIRQVETAGAIAANNINDIREALNEVA